MPIQSLEFGRSRRSAWCGSRRPCHPHVVGITLERMVGRAGAAAGANLRDRVEVVMGGSHVGVAETVTRKKDNPDLRMRGRRP